MKKSNVLQNKRVARQRNRRLKRRQRSWRQWLARLAKARHSLASFVVARHPAPAGARGFYKGGTPPRRRSPTVERLLWSGNIEYRLFPQDFGGQALRKQRPVAITEPSSRLPALTPFPLVARVIGCSNADFLGDHRRLSPLSSRVSVGWGPLPEAGALRVITPAPEPERLPSDQPRAGGQVGSGALEGLPERPWPLGTHTHALLRSRCSGGDPLASWAGCHQVKLTVVALKGSAKSAIDGSPPGTEQPASSDENGRISRRVFLSDPWLRKDTRSHQATWHLRKTRGFEKSYHPCKRLSSRKALSGAKNQRHSLGKTKAAVPQVGDWLGAVGGVSLRKRELLRALLIREVRKRRTGSLRDHSTQVPLKSCYGYQFMPGAFDGNWGHLNREERDEIQQILHGIESDRLQLWWRASVCGEPVPEEVFQKLYFLFSRFNQPGLDRREQVIYKILWSWFSDLVSIDIFAEKKPGLPWIACFVNDALVEEFKAGIRDACQEKEYRDHASFKPGEISSGGFDEPRNRTAYLERFTGYRQYLAQGMASMLELEDILWEARSSGDHDNPKSKRLVDNGGGAALCLDCFYRPPFRPVRSYGY